MDAPLPPQKKGIGPLGWIGIGCAGVVGIGLLVTFVATMMYGGKLKEFAESAQKNPTRLTAMTMIKMSAGTVEMIVEDDANRRYTVRQKENGKLTTVYWNEKKQAPEIVSGDFSAIPAGNSSASPTALPTTPPLPPAVAPGDAGSANGGPPALERK